MSKILNFALISLLFWTSIAVVSSLPHLEPQQITQDFVLCAVSQWWAWGLLVPAILAVDYVLPFSHTRITPRVLVHLFIGPVFALLYWYLEGALELVLCVTADNDILSSAFLHTGLRKIFFNMLIYSLIVGIWQVYLHRRQVAATELQVARLKQSFSEAQLNILRMQLDPHFLFNALNTVSSQVERDPKLARKMIEHLGDLLRLSLTSQGEQEIPFAKELEFLDHYLAIQRLRFGEMLAISIDVDPALRTALVPSLFIQPLVENAIRHGISKKIDGGSIAITARHADGQIMVRILDDGAGLPENWSMEDRSGIGLKVTCERFAGLYAAHAYQFDVRPRAGGGTEVSIVFPLRMNQEARS
jgi:LytS/YehU family sensor histidine kinase